MRSRLGYAPALIAALAMWPAPADAQTRGQREDPSARSAGMGGASAAVPWSDEVNDWANPALLGFANGLRYRWSNTQLFPAIAPDLTFQTDRFSYGWGGIGLAYQSHTLSYGRIPLTDPNGVPIGTFEPTENIRPLSGGVSLARTLEAVASLRSRAAPRVTRFADVAVGFSRKRIRVRMLPAPAGEADAVANDFGVLVRATPLPGNESGRPTLDLTYGFAALNYNDAVIAFPAYAIQEPVARQDRHGIAARVGIPRSLGMAGSLERRFGRWIAAGMDPLLSLAVAADFGRHEQGLGQGSGFDQVGVELVIHNTLSLRFGHVNDAFFGLDHDTFGVGLGISLAQFAGARYDFARYPQSGFPASGESALLSRHAFALRFDPVAFVRR